MKATPQNHTANSQQTADAVNTVGTKSCCSMPLIVIFGLQLLLIVGAYVGITVMFVVSQESQINDNAKSIAVKSLLASANTISAPIVTHRQTTRTLNRLLRASPSLQLQNLNLSSPTAYISLYSILRSFAVNISFTAYTYQDYDLGTPSPVDSSYNAALEIVYSDNGGWVVGANGDFSYYDPIPRSEPNVLSSFNSTPSSVSSGAPPSSNLYFYEPMAYATMDHDHWTAPYLWSDPTGVSILMTLGTCLEPNLTSGGCRNLLLQDLNIGYLNSVIGSYGSTPNSIVSLVDMRSLVLLSTSDSISTLNGSNGWSISATPSVQTNIAFAKFAASCPQLVNCAPLVDLNSGDKIYSGMQIAPVEGVNLVLLDISDRSYYFATADQARTVAIIVVVVVSCAAIAACVMTYLGVSTPIASLIEGFALASVMKNDEVIPTSSSISEVQKLSENFDKMNAKLLAARAYMPQSMLHGDDDDDDVDETVSEGTLEESRRSSNLGGSSRMDQSQIGASGSFSKQSRTSNGSGSRGFNSAATSGALVDKKVTVLVVNIVGLHSLAQRSDGSSIVRDFSKWMDAVQTAVKHDKGVIDAFHGDRVVITFNSSNTVAAHSRRAALCALEIAQLSEKLSFRLLSMGIATGRALTGSIGTSSIRTFMTLGHLYTQAAVLERTAKHFAVRDQATAILASEASTDDMNGFLYSYMVGKCPLLGMNGVVMIAGVVVKSGDDEWLYEMDSAANKNPFKAFDDSMKCLMRGATEEAKTILAKCASSFEKGTSGAPTPADTGCDLMKRMMRAHAYIKRQIDGAFDWKIDGSWCVTATATN